MTHTAGCAATHHSLSHHFQGIESGDQERVVCGFSHLTNLLMGSERDALASAMLGGEHDPCTCATREHCSS
jgi:hypothetical protein